MTDPNHEEDKTTDAADLLRMVDMRIPLPYVIGGFILAMGTLISMYYQLQALSEGMKTIQATVSSSITSTAALSREQDFLKFRITNLENDLARMRSEQTTPPHR